MGLFDFLKGKKKEEFADLDSLGPQGGIGGYGPAGPSMPMQQMPGMPPQDFMGGLPPASASGIMGGLNPDIENLKRSVEALNYKLDSLKAALDSINARLANIETAMKVSPGSQQGGWAY